MKRLVTLGTLFVAITCGAMECSTVSINGKSISAPFQLEIVPGGKSASFRLTDSMKIEGVPFKTILRGKTELLFSEEYGTEGTKNYMFRSISVIFTPEGWLSVKSQTENGLNKAIVLGYCK
jgi:hypothetical protein